MDAITLLRQDHKAIEQLFKKFENVADDAKTTKRELVSQLVRALTVHAFLEEEVFYPAIRKDIEGLESDVLRGLEEHHVVKWLCRELEGLEADHERLDAKATVLIDTVRHHVKEEETELFPAVRAGLGRKRLSELGESLAEAKTAASTRPEPQEQEPDAPAPERIRSRGRLRRRVRVGS